MNTCLIPILSMTSALALAFALPLNGFVRIAMVVAGLLLGLALIPQGRDALSNAGWLLGTIPNPNENLNEATAPIEAPDQATITYRVVATIRVNGESRSGSALQRVTIRRNITFGSNQISDITVRFFGEGVIIPIEDDSYLIVTMFSQNKGYENILVSPCESRPASGSNNPYSAEEVLLNVRNFSHCVSPLDRLPLMLAVPDSTRPEGLMEVLPANLSSGFDSNVEFVSLKFEEHNGPLQHTLEKYLPWMGQIGVPPLLNRVTYLSSGETKYIPSSAFIK